MATIDISDLVGKVENEGKTPSGKIGAEEWNRLAQAVIANQHSVKGVKINGSATFNPDDNGIVSVVLTESSYVLNITQEIIGRTAPYRVALGNPFILRLGVSEKYIDGEDLLPVGVACTATLLVNNIAVDTMSVYDEHTYDIDFGQYLSEGVNYVKVQVADNYSNIKETLEYEVTAVSLNVSLPNFDAAEVHRGEWELDVLVTGSTANVYILIDGEGGLVGSQTAGSTATYTITDGTTNSHHSLEVYAVLAEDSTIRTESIITEFIFSAQGSTATVIGTSLLANTELTMYNVLSVPYWIYIPNFTGTKEVVVQIVGDNDVLASSTQEVEFSNGSSGVRSYDLSLFDTELIGDRDVVITCNGTSRTIPITINASDITLSEISGYDLYLSSAGRSNSDVNYDEWSFNNIQVDLSDLDFVANGSGWLKDKDNNVALHIRKGHTITIPYYPFADNPAFGNGSDVEGTKRGMTFSIELATRNCTKRDASVVRCVYNGVGFEFKANSMSFASNNESLAADYREDTHVRIDLVIEGRTTAYSYQSGEETLVSNEALMLVYVDGVYQQMKLITETTDFKQGVAQAIEIGSPYCDVDVYCVRGYRAALNHKGIVDNYAYDTPVVEDKIAIAKRNDVFDSNLNVSYNKLRAARPNLPVMLLEMEALPTSKTKIALDRTTYDNPDNINDYDAGNASFVSTDDEVGCQGTSSMNYPVPYRNLDWKGGSNILVNGQKVSGLKLYSGMPASKKFTFKKDYASSEMANNVLFSMLYNQMAVGLRNTFPNCLTLAQKNLDINYRQTLFGIPFFIFQYWNNTYTPIGMFNFINNKNDEKVLGFVGAYTYENASAQCWEIRDNNIFWDFVIPEATWDNSLNNGAGGMGDSVFKWYEARYPKESTQDASLDFGDCGNAGQLEHAKLEHAPLLRLHNWLVSTNQSLASGALLTSPYTDGNGNTYNYDTKAYRLAKFTTEAENYLVVDQWILYYIWRETFWMYDSGSKNLQIYTMDGTHWGAIVRDADTGAGIDNEGKNVFPPYLEDNDYVVNNEFVFDQSSVPAGGSTVLNGQNGAVWINIRDGYKPRIQAMFAALIANAQSTGFSYEQTTKIFEDHQGKWSEALYNFGMKQYHGGAPYSRWIESGLGDKKNQRRFWMYYAFRYRMSKYHAELQDNRITWRTYGQGCDLRVKTYTQMYVGIGFGTYDYATVTKYRVTNPEVGALVRNGFRQSVNDAICYVFDGDLLTDIGNLYEFGDIAALTLTCAKRLESLRLGLNTDAGVGNYVNTRQTSLSLTECAALKFIDLTNCQGFGSGSGQNGIYSLDLSNQMNLEELYLWGCSITGITLPQTSTLHTLVLGGNLKNLRLVNLTSLDTFDIEGTSNLETIYISNSPLVDTLDIVGSVYTQLTSVYVDNIEWELNNANMLMRLAALGSNCTLKGHISIEGANKVSFAQKVAFMQAWGDIDDPNNDLYIEYEPRPISSITISGARYTPVVGEYQYSAKPDVQYANNFSSIEWFISTNSFATINRNTGLLTVTAVGTEENEPQATITCRVTLTNGDVIEETRVVGFYERSAKPGDYVYFDGTYSAPEDLDESKTVVGICYYVNGNDRRMVARLNAGSSLMWGLYNNASQGVANMTLDDDTAYNVYDTPIANITTAGISSVSDSSYRNSDNTDFALMPEGSAAADFGTVALPRNILGIAAGTIVPVGRYKTLLAIEHRNKILQDSSQNLIPPAATSLKTETTVLTEAIAAIVAERGNYYRQLYYPAASYAYAYEPTVQSGEELADKFKSHNWFLPAMGDLCRLYWYKSKGYTQGVENAIFAAPYAKNRFEQFSTSQHWSVTEYSATNAWYLYFSSGTLSSYVSKNTTYVVRAVCAF